MVVLFELEMRFNCFSCNFWTKPKCPRTPKNKQTKMGQILFISNVYITVYLPILFSCGWWSILEPAVTPLRSNMQSENTVGIRDFPSVCLFIHPCRRSGNYLCRKLKLAAFALLVFKCVMLVAEPCWTVSASSISEAVTECGTTF